MGAMESLSRFLERGSYPKELVALGIKEYRKTSFKPWQDKFVLASDGGGR